jgi:hypothetical protein
MPAFDRFSFTYLRSVLGAPARTFSYLSSGREPIEDHVWRCGCAAREESQLCSLEPCGRHEALPREAFFRQVASLTRRPDLDR